MNTNTIKGPAIPIHQPGANKFFDVYNTTNHLTYHPVDRESASYFNGPLATFKPKLPERGPMRDIDVFLHATADRIPRTNIKSALNTNGLSEASAKYRIPRRELFQTLLPRHKYLEDWSNQDGRLLTKIAVSEYTYTIGDRSPGAINLLLGRKFDTSKGLSEQRPPSLSNIFRPRR